MTGAKRQLDKSLAQVTPGGTLPPGRRNAGRRENAPQARRRARQRRLYSAEDIQALVRRAALVAPPGRFRRDDERPTTAMWDMAGDCEAPERVELWGRPSPPIGKSHVIVAPGSQKSAGLTLGVRCRKCGKCLKYRQRVWTNRAVTEWRDSVRSWFGTLTWSLDEHVVRLARARHRMAQRSIDWDALPPIVRFQRLCDQYGTDVTRWLKRVRKRSGAKLRCLVVAEAHKSGYPHYHVLVHETQPNLEVGERTLRGAWSEFHGHAKFNLVRDARAAAYATKYLNKSAMARVRASRRYGVSTLEGDDALRHKKNHFSVI